MKSKIKGLLCLLLTAFSLTACVDSSVEDVAVMKIDGQEIMKSEYMVYLYTTTKSFVSAAGEDVWSMDFDGQTADELVEERTINTIQSVIAAKEYAEANGIALTEEQKAAAAEAAEQFMQGVSAEDLKKMNLDVKKLKRIPLVFAGWLRYLMAIDDNGNPFELSPDPLLETVCPVVAGIKLGDNVKTEPILRPILENEAIFGVNLYEVGMAGIVCGYFEEMISGVGAVRETLVKYIG
jgi:hypothetical protein